MSGTRDTIGVPASMTDTLLGLIALGTLTTAVVQVVVIVALLRSGQKALARVERLKFLVAPLPAHVAAIREDVDRMKVIAGRQLDKVGALYAAIEPPLRHGMTAFAVMRASPGSGRENDDVEVAESLNDQMIR